MLHHFRGPLERADFADTGDVTSVPFYSELEVFVGIESLWINTELSHWIVLGLGFDLPGELLDLDDDKFSRFKWRKADKDVHDAVINIVLCGGLLVALDEISFARRFALERALSEEALHERADVEPDLRPKRLIVRLKNNPLCAAKEALLEKERRPPDRDVFPLGSESVIALQRPRAPNDPAAGWHGAQTIDA